MLVCSQKILENHIPKRLENEYAEHVERVSQAASLHSKFIQIMNSEAAMTTIYEIRRENLRTLIRERGNSELSKAAGYSSASYISQMAGRKARRQVTEQTARKIEDGLSLPQYWLDQECDLRNNPTSVTTSSVAPPPPEDSGLAILFSNQTQFFLCAAAVSNAMASAGTNLSTKKFTAIATTLLNQADQSEIALEKAAKLLISIAV